MSQDHVPDEVYQSTLQYFSDRELVVLTLAIITINGWNRLAVSFRTVPGTYQSHSKTEGNINSAHLSEELEAATGKAATSHQ